jgi:hypothetical protein
MTTEEVEDDGLHGLHARQIWILVVLLIGTVKTLYVCSSCWQRKGTSSSPSGCLSDYPQLPRHLNGCGGSPVSRRELNLMEAIFRIYDKCTLSTITHKLNISGTTFIWSSFLAFVCGTRAQILSAPFRYILYILRLGIFYFLLFYGTTPINSDYNIYYFSLLHSTFYRQIFGTQNK